MTNDQTDENVQAREASSAELTQKPESKEMPPKPKAHPKKSRKPFALMISVVLILTLLGVGVAGGYYIWLERSAAQDELVSLKQQMVQVNAVIRQLKSSQENFVVLTSKRDAAVSNQLQSAEQRIQAQHKKLMSLSSTSREDWLLAEAEYLLRLANQRVLIERSPRSADGLLSQADEILRKLNDPDLFALRQAIANDLTKLRLVKEIDHEGLYFALQALSEQVNELELRPSRQALMGNSTAVDPANIERESVPSETEESSIWKKMGRGLIDTFSFMNQYVRYRTHDQAPPVLLAPESASYLQQNMILKIERAQLALLREQDSIYRSSLDEVQVWLNTYYPQSQKVEAFYAQIEKLKAKDIVQALPDISYSLELLHDYIERVHKLEGLGQPAPTSGAAQ